MAGRRKDYDKSPRKTKVAQVCLTEAHDRMLTEVAARRHKGRVSLAVLALIDKPLRKAYLELCATEVLEETTAS